MAVPKGVSLAAAPSGMGELALSNLTVFRNRATFTVSNGVPGRVYTLGAITQDENNDFYQHLMFLPMVSTLAADPPPLAPSEAFGDAITWGISMTQFSPTSPTGQLTLASGGASQLFALSVVNGGVVYNPSDPVSQGIYDVDQGIITPESIWIDITGAAAIATGGSTSLEIVPGGTFELFGITGTVTWTANTTSHKICGVVW